MFIGTKENGRFRPRATAFLVSVVIMDARLGFFVTAEHVVSGLVSKGFEPWLRVNRLDGTVEETKVPADAWWFHPDGERHPTDVAALPANLPSGGSEAYELMAVALNGDNSVAATPDVIRERAIGVGEEIAIVGLFRNHYGQEKNIPIVRIGNIAAMPEEPVQTKYCGYTDAYLVEARSISGLSGSPVFVNMAPTRIVSGRAEITKGNQFYLLGLMHGHFDIRNLRDDSVVDDADGGGGINTGIGLVIPVEKIIETILRSEHIEEIRAQVIAHRRANGAVPDA